MPFDTVANLIGKIQAPAVIFKTLHHADALLIMAETAIHHSVQRPLSRVAEGRMAEIMGQRPDVVGVIFLLGAQ